jgi:hypothetical protein
MADCPFALIRPDTDPERGFPTALAGWKRRVSAALAVNLSGGGGNRTRARFPQNRSRGESGRGATGVCRAAGEARPLLHPEVGVAHKRAAPNRQAPSRRRTAGWASSLSRQSRRREPAWQAPLRQWSFARRWAPAARARAAQSGGSSRSASSGDHSRTRSCADTRTGRAVCARTARSRSRARRSARVLRRAR